MGASVNISHGALLMVKHVTQGSTDKYMSGVGLGDFCVEGIFFLLLKVQCQLSSCEFSQFVLIQKEGVTW